MMPSKVEIRKCILRGVDFLGSHVEIKIGTYFMFQIECQGL